MVVAYPLIYPLTTLLAPILGTRTLVRIGVKLILVREGVRPLENPLLSIRDGDGSENGAGSPLSALCGADTICYSDYDWDD